MTPEQSSLLALVRAGLAEQTEGEAALCDFAFSPFHAETLLRLAHEQGVTGIAWTGYERLYPRLPSSGRLATDAKLQWYAAAQGVARRTKVLFARAAEWAEALHREGTLRCVVLKGIDYARMYPDPAYREYGDLDCWLCGEARRGDEVARRVGATCEGGGYKHTHILYQGLTVENHYFFTSHNNTRQGRHAEEVLRGLMEGKPEPIADSRLLSPPPAFTALFLLHHACGHFLAEGIRLRHVTDWLMFLRRYGEVVERADVRRAMEEMRLLTFASVLTTFCKRYLGLSAAPAFPRADERLVAAFTRDLFARRPEVYDRRLLPIVGRIGRRFVRMWRFRAFLDESYWLKVRNTFTWSSFMKRRVE